MWEDNVWLSGVWFKVGSSSRSEESTLQSPWYFIAVYGSDGFGAPRLSDVVLNPFGLGVAWHRPDVEWSFFFRDARHAGDKLPSHGCFNSDSFNRGYTEILLSSSLWNQHRIQHRWVCPVPVCRDSMSSHPEPQLPTSSTSWPGSAFLIFEGLERLRQTLTGARQDFYCYNRAFPTTTVGQASVWRRKLRVMPSIAVCALSLEQSVTRPRFLLSTMFILYQKLKRFNSMEFLILSGFVIRGYDLIPKASDMIYQCCPPWSGSQTQPQKNSARLYI